MAENVNRAVKETLQSIYGKPSAQRSELFATVLNIVDKKWNPKRVESWDEKKYQKGLFDMLVNERDRPLKEHGVVSETKITTEDSRRGSDVLVARGGEKVAVELKLDLKSSDVRRSKQQFEDFVKDYSSLIVVLLGDTHRNAFEEVREKILQLNKLNPQKPIKLLKKPF